VTRDTIFQKVTEQMSSLFGIDPATLTAESRFEDLDITSIDAIDLIIELQRLIGRRLPEQELRAIRTVGDVVATVERHLPAGATPTGT
jgi:acyl carrier protein